MLVWGIAAMVVAWAPAPAVAPVDSSVLRLSYRIGPPPRPDNVDRATPVLNALAMASRGRRRGRRTEAVVGPITLAIESGHSRQTLNPSASWSGAPRGIRSPVWTNAKELAIAAAADWSLGDGEVRVGGGFDRIRMADVALSRGKTGAQILVAAVDYLDDNGWSLGGGWRSTAAAKGSPSDRLVSLSHAAPLSASGGFLHAAFRFDAATSFQIEGAIGRVGARDAQIFSSDTDRRTMLTLRRQLP